MDTYEELKRITTTYPAIDNHAHPLLKAENRGHFPFEGLVSEAHSEALIDAVHTLSCFRTTAQLRELYGMRDGATWEDIKSRREKMNYDELCRLCFESSGIQCLLIDDGLAPVGELAEIISWHDQLTSSRAKRIVRIEPVAEDILVEVMSTLPTFGGVFAILNVDSVTEKLTTCLKSLAFSPEVVAFKSVVCYRTGLDVNTTMNKSDVRSDLLNIHMAFQKSGKIRMAHKALNDHLVCIAVEVAGQAGIPVQFHTGFGDNDVTLAKSTPSLLQPLIKKYPSTNIVLLHSSYPFTREAGYLTSVYKNVFLDFGMFFTLLSREGQRSVIRQVLELCPTNKIMWSTDGHWWPESFYLGSIEARSALCEVLAASVQAGDLSLGQASSVLKNALFHNTNNLYKLNLQPNLNTTSTPTYSR